MWLYLVAVVIITLSYLVYWLLYAPQRDFWSKYGIRQINPSDVVNPISIVLGKMGMAEGDKYIYSQLGFNEKFCGFVEMGKPFLFVKDLDLLKRILVKDYEHFVDRRKFFTKEHGILGRMLVNLEGEEWKAVRSAVSPTFTTGKIRRMMDIFNIVGIEWVEEFTSKAKENEDSSMIIDVGKTTGQYTVEVISLAVFGMKSDSVKNPDSAFCKMVERLVNFFNLKGMIKLAICIGFPKISQRLGIIPVDRGSLQFFENIFESELRSRLSGENKRNDFIQLLAEAKLGKLKGFGSDELNEFEKDAEIKVKGETDKKLWLTDEIMTAQSVMFFFAGFGTVSSLIQFVMYALALHQNVQEKLRKEIDKIIKEDGLFDYDDIGKLVFMDMVVCETLRLFPGGERLERVCVREYRDPELGLVIPKGTFIACPVHSLHHSKEFYENPDKFDPEHFSPEKKSSRNPYSYLAFGSGPRNCVGMRFALIEAKTAIAQIIHNFRIEPTRKTPVKLEGRSMGFNTVIPKDLELKITSLKE